MDNDRLFDGMLETVREVVRDEMRRQRAEQRGEETDRARPNRVANDAIRKLYHRAKAKSAGQPEQDGGLPTAAMVDAKRRERIAAGEATGKCKPGSVRDLAAYYGVAPSTIQRRLRELAQRHT
jgi:alkylation response protein AidB-like acyl-CoA dehydrogenase